MANANFNHASPVQPGKSTFFVRATSDIAATKRTILKGEYVLIDPLAVPCAGRLVMVGSNLEPWNQQGGILGVATLVCSDVGVRCES